MFNVLIEYALILCLQPRIKAQYVTFVLGKDTYGTFSLVFLWRNLELLDLERNLERNLKIRKILNFSHISKIKKLQ